MDLKGEFFMSKENKRGRNWTIVVYPESVPKDWRSKLDDLHIAWIESPLHDKDTNPDGTIKKAHWHVLLLFDGLKSFEQVKEIANSINAPIPQRVESARGMVRYMIHLDNPEKYQYKQSDIIGHGGADVESYFALTATNRLDILKDIVLFIRENNITEFSDLTFYAIENNSDWFDVIANHNSIFLRNLLSSMRNKQQDNLDKPISRDEQVKMLKNQGLTQTKVADQLGVSLITVKRHWN